MKLIITRHAKSSWDDPLLDDHDRPLNARGREAASRIGNWITEQGHVPDHVLCSTAERAKWTCALAIEQMATRPVVDMESGLYHAGPDSILRLIHQAPTGDLMVVGHNPGFAEFASMITRERPRHIKFGQYPTAATLVVEADIAEWSALAFGSAKLVDFVVPRDLDPA
ncbi:MAG: histidine phosphatase family protein [Paracoccaceae bacterium]